MRRGGGTYIGKALRVAISRKRPDLIAQNRLYLDHAATTPVLPEAQTAIADALGAWANPSSPHADGRAARAALERARADIAEALDWRHDIIFTSGATEAIAIAASRAQVAGRACGATEHDAVGSAMGDQGAVVPVNGNGLIDLAALDEVIAAKPTLVAVQQVNNETGVVQPLAEIAERVRSTGSLLLSDCAQGAGKRPLPDADFIAVAAHKIGGPPGFGALLVKDIAKLASSGGQERGYRRGTENLPAAAGLAAALKSRAFADAMPRLADLRKRLEAEIIRNGGLVIASDAERSAAIGAYTMPGVASTSQLVQFDLAGIAVSAGSACSSGSMKPSKVLEAMGLPADIVSTVIRVSFGPDTSEADIDRFVAAWRVIRERASSRAA